MLKETELSTVSGGFLLFAVAFTVLELTGITSVIPFVEERLEAGRPECEGRRNGKPYPENCAYRGVEEYEGSSSAGGRR